MAIVFLYALDESVCVQTTTSVDEPRKTLLERFHRVLQVPVPFSDDEEREECQVSKSGYSVVCFQYF